MATDAALSDRPSPEPELHEPFETFGRQTEAAVFGLWAFLASEVLLFGGLFLTYTVYRWTSGAAFSEAAQHTNVFIGALNTVFLLTSSLTIAVAGRALQAGKPKAVRWGIWLTLAFACAFLVAKGVEYHQDFEEGLWPGPAFALAAPAGRIFFGLYWTMTGLHAVHVSIGLAFIGRLAWMDHSGVLATHPDSMETTSLYWHLVDAIWVVVFPCLYLVGR